MNDTTDNSAPTDLAATESNVDDGSGLPQPDDTAQRRQCSRCRSNFSIEPDTHPMELLGWWTCRPCTETLLPGRHRATTANVDPTGRPS